MYTSHLYYNLHVYKISFLINIKLFDFYFYIFIYNEKNDIHDQNTVLIKIKNWHVNKKCIIGINKIQLYKTFCIKKIGYKMYRMSNSKK